MRQRLDGAGRYWLSDPGVSVEAESVSLYSYLYNLPGTEGGHRQTHAAAAAAAVTLCPPQTTAHGNDVIEGKPQLVSR